MRISSLPPGRRKSIMNTLSRSSIAFMNGPRKDSRLLYDSNSPKFSDLTNTNNQKKNLGGIQKKIIKKKVQDENKSEFKVIWPEFAAAES